MSYRIDPHLPLTSEFRRIASRELDVAIQWLSNTADNPDKALHETRKQFKSVRALLSLIRTGDKEFAKAENKRYRDAASRLAAARQAGALVETVNRLENLATGKASRGAIAATRESLLHHRSFVLSDDLQQVLDDAISVCREGLARLQAITLPDAPEEAADILASGAARVLKHARHALRRAQDKGEEDAFHDLRKAAKAHMQHLALLRDFWPSPVKSRRKDMAELAEKLGELQDVFVLRRLIGIGEPAIGNADQTRQLDRLCKRSERKLRKACLALADEMFHENPKRPARKMVRKVRKNLAAKACLPKVGPVSGKRHASTQGVKAHGANLKDRDAL